MYVLHRGFHRGCHRVFCRGFCSGFCMALVRIYLEGVHFTLYNITNMTQHVAKLLILFQQRVPKRVFSQIQRVIFVVEGLQFLRIANLVLYAQCRFFLVEGIPSTKNPLHNPLQNFSPYAFLLPLKRMKHEISNAKHDEDDEILHHLQRNYSKQFKLKFINLI